MPLLDQSGWLCKFFRQQRRKLRIHSGTQLFLDLLSSLATAAQVGIPVYWGYKRSKESAPIPWELYAYLAIVLYNLIHRHFLAKHFKPKRLSVEETRRPMRLAEAMSRLTVAIETGAASEKTLSEIQYQALELIASEVENLIGDQAGLYLNASLIVPDQHDQTKIKCIARSNTYRKCPKWYQKQGMLAWRCIEEGVMRHEPNYHPKDDQPYRSILCFPLIYKPEGAGETRSLGCVTIDHSRDFEFLDLERRIEISASPYFRILELVLVYEAKQLIGGLVQSEPKKTPVRPQSRPNRR